MSNFWNDEMQTLLENVKFDKEEKTVEFGTCPICGERVTIYDGLLDGSYMMNGYYIQCNCGLEFSIGECTLEELATAWNVRKPIQEIIEKLESSSFWTRSTFDEDGYSNDDSEEVVYLDRAIEVVKEVVGEMNE